MAARPMDAAEGYELFRRHTGRIELDEINEYLRGMELRQVSPRMYSHYQKLKRYGYESYIAINRLDIAVAGEYAWSDDMRARYPEIAQPLEGEGFWNAERYRVFVERLGAVSAVGGSVLIGAIKILEMLIAMRETWYEGTKSKYEAQSIALDTEIKRRNAQLEADQELLISVEAEIDQDQSPLLDSLETEALPKGEPGDQRRQRLVEAIRAGIALPIEVALEITTASDPADGQ